LITTILSQSRDGNALNTLCRLHCRPLWEAEYLRLEPTKKPMNEAQKAALAPVRTHWLAKWDDFRTLKWIDSVKCPELVIKQVKGLLATS